MKHIISTIFILVFYSFILNANSKTFQKLKTLDSTFAQKIEIDWRARDYYLDTIVSKKGEFNNFPDSLIYSSMLSKWINEYNVRYRYKNNNLLAFLKDSLKLKNLSAEPFDILLNDSTTNKGLKSPNLYIAILRSALSCESIINSKQRDTLSNILLSELENYEDLYIETYIDSKRDSLVQIINKYPNNPRIVRAIVNDINRKFHLSKDDLYYERLDKQCDSIINRFPNSLYINDIYDLKVRMRVKALYIKFNKQLYPNKEYSFEINSTNIKKLIIKIYRELDNTSILIFSDSINIESNLNIPKITKSPAIKIPSIGNYKVDFIMDDGSSFSQDFTVSKVASLVRKTSNNYQLYSANYMSGKPIKEREIVYYLRNKEELVGQQLLNSVGFTDINFPLDNYNWYEVKTCVNNDIYSTPIEVYYDTPNPVKESSIRYSIYTDRKRYNPSDTIFYKGYMYNVSSNYASMEQDKKVHIKFTNNTGKLIDSTTLVTNNWGTVNGYFIAPKDINGDYGISINNNYCWFNVDEYKPATLDIIITPTNKDYKYGDNIEIESKISSLSGFNIGGATIKYKVEEYLSRYSSKNNKDIVIKNGEDKSDINGEFKFSFIAPATKDGLQIKYPSTYLITVYATDIKGESKEVTQYIRIGNNRYNINSNIPNIVEANSNFEPIIELSNYQNKAISGIKNEYIIEQNNNIILKGEYYSGVPIKIDWSSFKQGKYSFIALNSDGDNYKKDFIIFSKKATSPPIDTLTFFASTSKVCNANTPISFVFGTNTNMIYASLTLSYGDSIILNRNMVFKKGMKEYNLPYLDKYPAAISLQLDFIYDCKLYSYKRDYSRENIDKPIKMKFISLRDKVEPDSIEKFSILVTDTLGNPIEAEIMLTAYNKASDTPRPNIFNKLNIAPPYLPSLNIRSSSFNESYVWKRHISNKSNIIAGVNRVVDNDVVDDDIILEESIPFATGNNMEKSSDNIRTDFTQTAAFLPNLLTNKSGIVDISFRLPSTLTTYMVRALANTKDARSCVENSQIVVSKELMILPNIPQFMRRGDTLVMKTLCTNLSNKEVSAKVSLKLFNPTTGKSLPIESKEITLGQQESKNVDWVITTNGMNSEIGIEVWLESDDYKDGERHIIPIIEPVESFNGSESAILINEKKIFNLNNIIVKGAQNQYLGVIASSPQVMLLQALPNNLDSTSKSFIDLINRWYINGAGGKMALKYSTQIKNNSLLKDTINIINESVLENIALSQSPWATEDKTQRLNYLIKLLDTNYIKLQNSQIINSINNFQNSDGGFPWFNGMQSSFLITNLYLNRANSLITLNLLDTLAKNTIQKSIDYLDNYIDSKFKSSNKIDYEIINYLYTRSLFNDYNFSSLNLSLTWNSIIDLAQKQWQKYSIIERAKLALALNNMGRDYSQILASLRKYAVKGESTHTIFFPNAVMPFRGFINNELEAHLTLLQLFMLSKEDKDIANGIACWILLQKKNQQWDNPVTTLNVTSVIWNYYNTITHSNYSVKFSKLKQANVEIENSSNSPLFIDFIYTYNLPLTKVEKKGNGFKIERELYRETNNGYEELTNKTALNIGDKIIAKYIINNSENRNFIRLKSLRNGAFMPANDVSGYNYKGYYRDIKPSYTDFFFYTLPQGITIIEEEFFVSYSGFFNSGLVQIQSLYDPAYYGNSGM